MVSCDKPTNGTWASVGGDCQDDNPSVNPGQAAFFEKPFGTSGGIDSFDYNCSGGEEGDPSQTSAPSCAILSLTGCRGAGYAPTTRSGKGVNVLCGSNAVVTCQVSSLLGTCGTSTTASQVAYRCK
jgi:hypothetical protein